MAVLQKKSSHRYIHIFFIGLLLLLIVFLRFFKLGENFIFDIDTQYQALLAKTIINHFHIIWIGVSASNIGYYLGPGLVYLTAFLLWFTKGDPISLAFFSAFVGVVTAMSIYYIAQDLFNRRVAIISMIIYGFSSFIISYDQRYWPIFVPLIATWMYYGLIKAKKNTRWLIISIILISLSYHIHLTLLILWPFIIWTLFKVRKKIVLSTWLTMIVSYFIITFPLLVFDFVHNFDNMRMPIRFITGLLKKTASINQPHFGLFLSSLNKIIFFNHQNNLYLQFFLITIYVILVIAILRAKKTYPIMLLISITTLYILLFCFYPGPIQEYYIVFLFPFIALLIGWILSKTSLAIVIPLLTIFIIANTLVTLGYQTSRGLAAKKTLIQKATVHLNSDYYLSYDGAMDYEGWRYLFDVYGSRKPTQSKADDMFGWIYPKDISPIKPPLIINISNDFKVTIW